MVDTVEFLGEETTGEKPVVAPTPPVAPEQLPDTVPENIRKSYADQRAEITRLQQELATLKKPKEETPPADENTPPPEEKKPEETPPPDGQEEAAKKAADAAGVDLAPYQTEYNEKGDVSEENRSKLADQFKSVLGENARQIIDEFIEARKVVHANDTKLFMDAAGGSDQYKAMVTWAAASLTKEQVAAYNKQVESGDRHSVLFAVEGLRAKYESANGKPPQLVTGGTGGSTATSAFRSSAEMREAMRDPRYKKDPAYRDDVARRLAISNV